MAIQYSVTVRDARNDAIETAIGASPILQIRTGAPPANCGAASTGTVLATLNLPADWLAASAGGVKAKLGTWSDLSADATGTAGHFRIMNAAGSVCHMQGTVTATGGGGDMTVDSVNFTAGQSFTVNNFALTASGA